MLALTSHNKLELEYPLTSSVKDSLHHNKRLLIIDDCVPTAREIKNDIEKVFSHENRNLIEICNDPIEAITLIQGNANRYDALILDLRMPKMNGDQLLIKLAERNLLIPTVIHSGSHASDLQAKRLPQINDLIISVVTMNVQQLCEEIGATTQANLEALQTKLALVTSGVPLLFVEKYCDGYSTCKLTSAIESVDLIGGFTNRDNFNEAVKNFKPKILPDGVENDYIELCSQFARFISKKGVEFLKKVTTIIPELDKNELFLDRLECLKRLGGPKYSIKALSDEIESPRLRHNLPTFSTTPI